MSFTKSPAVSGSAVHHQGDIYRLTVSTGRACISL